MTTIRKYKCNCCKDEIDDSNPGLAFEFQAPGEDFRYNMSLWQFENHLCFHCITAIEKLSIEARRISRSLET